MGAHLKICGLTQPLQAAAVAGLGVNAIGVIAVERSARFLPVAQRAALWQAIAAADPTVLRVLVLVNPSDDQLNELEGGCGHQLLQLHGEESPERCRQLQRQLGLPVWKALRVRGPEDLEQASHYSGCVDALLLDAWSAAQHGGTGERLPLQWLQRFSPDLPWWLAGGIGPANAVSVLEALALAGLQPTGLDASSSVEYAPGDKDVAAVARLVAAVRGWTQQNP